MKHGLPQKVKKFINKGGKKILYFMAVAPVFMSNMTAKASVDFSFLKGQGNGTFSDLNNTAKQTGASLYQLFLTVGIIGVVLSGIGVGIGLAFNKNANKREENKSQLIWIAIGGVIIFGILSLIGLVQSVAAGL